LAKAFKAFFRGTRRYPKFKKYRRYGSFVYPQAYHSCIKLELSKSRIFLPKIGNVKIVSHRPIPAGAKLKTCTVKCEPDGEWYACLVYDISSLLGDLPTPECWAAPVGIDLGLKSIATTSDGEKVEPPRFLREAEKKLEHLQRSLSSKRKGSNNWSEARRKFAAQHARVSNQRKDFNHKISRNLVEKHDFGGFRGFAD
jgi:putative transposase